jgi:hypothetical protein
VATTDSAGCFFLLLQTPLTATVTLNQATTVTIYNNVVINGISFNDPSSNNAVIGVAAGSSNTYAIAQGTSIQCFAAISDGDGHIQSVW